MAVQTYSSLSQEQRTFYSGMLLKRLIPFLPLLQDALKTTIPANNGAVVQFRKWASLAVATSALTEGTTPSDTALSISTVTATIAQYGAFVKMSDLLIVAGIDNVLTETSGILGEQAGRTIHTLLVNELAANSSVRYASTAVSRVTVAAGMNLTVNDIRKTVRDLENNNAAKFPDNFYHGVISAKQKYDLVADPAYQDLYRYTNTKPLMDGTVGEVYGALLKVTTDAPLFAAGGAGSIDVHAALIYGPGAFGAIDIASMTVPNIDPQSERGINIIVIPQNQPSKTDPLMQYGIAGWKVAFVAKVLDSLRITRLETSVTA